MENRFLLQRQYHPLTVTCTAGSKYILGRDIRRGQILDPSTTFIRCCSEFVSRKHSEISCDSHGVWKVRDLGSMNGTFHQSSRLALDQVRELRHGDIIGLGIGDDGPIEGIDIRDEKYFIFKFVEQTNSGDAELIDLTDSEDACTIITASSTSSRCSANARHKKHHLLTVPEVNVHDRLLGHDKRNREGRSVNSDSATSHSSRDIKINDHRRKKSRSKSGSPKFPLRSKGENYKQSSERYFVVTTSEDDSSDGYSENNADIHVRNVLPVNKKVVNSEKDKINSFGNAKGPKEDKPILKPLKFANQFCQDDQAHDSNVSNSPGSSNEAGYSKGLQEKKRPKGSAHDSDSCNSHQTKKIKGTLKNLRPSTSDDAVNEIVKEVVCLKNPHKKETLAFSKTFKKNIVEKSSTSIMRRNHLEEVVKQKENKTFIPAAEYSRNNCDDELGDFGEDIGMDIENDEIVDVEEGMELDANDVAPEEGESLSRIISHSKDKAVHPQRKAKLIGLVDPLPIIGRKKKGLGTVERVSALPSGVLPVKSSKSEWQSDPITEARKKVEMRNQLLKQLSEKQKTAQEPKVQEEVFKKPKMIPKVKNCSKSRSANLLVAMVGSIAEVENLEKSNAAKAINSSNVRTPKELPLPSAEDAAKMPLNSFLLSKANAPSIQDERGERIVPPVARSNLLQKPNAVVQPSPEANDNVVFRIHNKKMVAPTHRSLHRDDPILMEDSIYKDICSWNASWLEEQRKYSAPPDVEQTPFHPNFKVISVLSTYQNYETYLTVFYPLMLHELWTSIHQDMLQNEKMSWYEYKVGIESFQFRETCPLTVVDPNNPKQGIWVDVRCHVFANNKKDIKSLLDLCLFKYFIKTKNSKDEVNISARVTFAFPLYNSESFEEINSKTLVNNNLYQQNPQFKLKCSFNLIFHMKNSERFEIAKERVAVLQRLSYISPKLRDFRALIFLPKCPLYKNILNPENQENSWSFNEHARYESLVPYCTPLNPRQKSVIDYVCNRIMKAKGKPDIMLIHGPPGTGKTRTIVGIVLQLVTSNEFKRENPTILVCTPSNTAIDEVVSRLHDALQSMNEDQRPLIVRIGESNKVSGNAIQYTPDLIAQRKMSITSAYDSILMTVKMKQEEISGKEKLKATIAGDTSKITRMKALDREIKELRTEISKLEENMKLVLTTTRADQEQLDKIKNTTIKTAQIVCSTLNYCSNSKLKNLFEVVNRKPSSTRPTPKFACCIMDEATQTTEPESLAPLAFNIEKMVLVGDPMQLDATVLSQKAKDNFYGRSLYHRLYDSYSKQSPSPVMMLREQYRMHEEILKWPNDSFYGGQLVKKPVRKNCVECPFPPYLFLNLTSRETGRETGEKGKSVSNEDETMLVVEILKIISTQLNEKKKLNIGVITPYSRQKDTLFKAIQEKVPAMASDVEVDTVDSFQGREKDIILISCVRTEYIGFLNNAKRLNVALTRAIHALYIIGNADCLKKNEMWESLIEDAELRKVIHTVPSDKTKQPSLLASLLRPILTSPRK